MEEETHKLTGMKCLLFFSPRNYMHICLLGMAGITPQNIPQRKLNS